MGAEYYLSLTAIGLIDLLVPQCAGGAGCDACRCPAVFKTVGAQVALPLREEKKVHAAAQYTERTGKNAASAAGTP